MIMCAAMALYWISATNLGASDLIDLKLLSILTLVFSAVVGLYFCVAWIMYDGNYSLFGTPSWQRPAVLIIEWAQGPENLIIVGHGKSSAPSGLFLEFANYRYRSETGSHVGGNRRGDPQYLFQPAVGNRRARRRKFFVIDFQCGLPIVSSRQRLPVSLVFDIGQVFAGRAGVVGDLQLNNAGPETAKYLDPDWLTFMPSATWQFRLHPRPARTPRSCLNRCCRSIAAIDALSQTR